MGVGYPISDLIPSQAGYFLPNNVAYYPIFVIPYSPFLQFNPFQLSTELFTLLFPFMVVILVSCYKMWKNMKDV